MSSYALAFAALGLIVLLGARREYTRDNRRDAKLLAACGEVGFLTVAAVWLV